MNWLAHYRSRRHRLRAFLPNRLRNRLWLNRCLGSLRRLGRRRLDRFRLSRGRLLLRLGLGCLHQSHVPLEALRLRNEI